MTSGPMQSPILLRSAAMLLASLSASAAERLVDRPLEELMELDIPTVTTASKFTQKSTEAPASVGVITAKEIKQFGYRTLGEALNSQAGAVYGVEASTHGGSLGTYGGRLTARKKWDNGFEALLSGSAEESDGNAGLIFKS